VYLGSEHVIERGYKGFACRTAGGVTYAIDREAGGGSAMQAGENSSRVSVLMQLLWGPCCFERCRLLFPSTSSIIPLSCHCFEECRAFITRVPMCYRSDTFLHYNATEGAESGHLEPWSHHLCREQKRICVASLKSLQQHQQRSRHHQAEYDV
jgi:hypothetical protein